jgi:hypothetical protein
MFETVMNILSCLVVGACVAAMICIPLFWFVSLFVGDPLEDLEKSLDMEIEDGIRNGNENTHKVESFRD